MPTVSWPAFNGLKPLDAAVDSDFAAPESPLLSSPPPHPAKASAAVAASAASATVVLSPNIPRPPSGSDADAADDGFDAAALAPGHHLGDTALGRALHELLDRPEHEVDGERDDHVEQRGAGVEDERLEVRR